MKKSKYNFKGLRFLFWTFLCAGLLAGGVFLADREIRAEKASRRDAVQTDRFSKSFSPGRAASSAVTVGERVSPWLKLEPGKPLATAFHGSEQAVSAMRNGTAVHRSQISVDFNFDGHPDLVSGFGNVAGGGFIVLHRGNPEAFQPEDERVLADLRRGIFPPAFEKDAFLLDAPVAPDFIVAGRFAEGSTLDIVFAARGGRSLFLLSSDSRGGFYPAREIPLDGEITALVSDLFDMSKTFSGLAVALKGKETSTVAVFDGSKEIFKTRPRSFSVENKIDSLLLINPEGAVLDKNLLVLAGGEIFEIARIGNEKAALEKIALPFRAAAFAAGEFIRDRRALTELAVLTESGGIAYLTRGTLDTRPFTTAEVKAFYEKYGRGRKTFQDIERSEELSNDWQIAEEHQLGISAFGGDRSSVLQKAYITGNETEDLLVTDAQNKQIRILFKEPNREENRSSFTGETKIQSLSAEKSPASVMPMRLNVMGQQGLVIYGEGDLEPATVMFAPTATFNVTKTADTNDGACNADCSVREAVVAANAAAGADLINLPAGTYTLTISGIDEDSSATGDLDIRDAITITGAGAGSTIIQAGTNTTNGIDKVFSINPTFSSPFATSFTGFTIQFGRNQSSFGSGVGFGGGFDWEASGTGTLTITGVTVTSNRTLDGDGGGIAATSFPPANAFISLTNSTVSNNDPDIVAPAQGPIGGGIYVGSGLTFRLTGTTVTGNNVVESSNLGRGGGIFSYQPASSAGKSFLNNSTVTSNIAPSNGGGIYTDQPLDISLTSINNNTSNSGSGGGIYDFHPAGGTTVINKATMTGNSAASGGAVLLGFNSLTSVLNMSFSRITGNTATVRSGVGVAGGTGILENNWWGCNNGPTAMECNGAGTIGGGAAAFDPWLQLRLTAASTNLVVGQTTGLTASFLTNSAGAPVAAGNLDVLIGRSVSWNASGGTISGQQTTIQSNGQATANFTGTAASPPTRTATAQVENGPATVNFTIDKADTTTTITGESKDPTAEGEPFTVFFSVTINAPGGGTPTGMVTVSDGVDSCSAPVAAGQCSLALTTVGDRTLTASYEGNANFNGSLSAGEPHTVLPITAAGATIGGRVQTQSGRGIAGVAIVMIATDGQIFTATSNVFGYFRFEDIPVGETYIINARHREYQFTPQAVSVFEDIEGLTLTSVN
jgi:CSLREA domain-containing protein